MAAGRPIGKTFAWSTGTISGQYLLNELKGLPYGRRDRHPVGHCQAGTR
jgi:hypothetical protein